MSTDDPERLLTARDLAKIYRVDEKTIRRWTIAGDFDDCVIRTPGGQLRYRPAAVRARTQTSRPGTSPPPGTGPGPTTNRPEGH